MTISFFQNLFTSKKDKQIATLKAQVSDLSKHLSTKVEKLCEYREEISDLKFKLRDLNYHFYDRGKQYEKQIEEIHKEKDKEKAQYRSAMEESYAIYRNQSIFIQGEIDKILFILQAGDKTIYQLDFPKPLVLAIHNYNLSVGDGQRRLLTLSDVYERIITEQRPLVGIGRKYTQRIKELYEQSQQQ